MYRIKQHREIAFLLIFSRKLPRHSMLIALNSKCKPHDHVKEDHVLQTVRQKAEPLSDRTIPSITENDLLLQPYIESNNIQKAQVNMIKLRTVKHACTPALEPIFTNEMKNGIQNDYFDTSSFIDLYLGKKMSHSNLRTTPLSIPPRPIQMKSQHDSFLLNSLNLTTHNLKLWLFLGILFPPLWIIGGVQGYYAKKRFVIPSLQENPFYVDKVEALKHWIIYNQILAIFDIITLIILLSTFLIVNSN